MSRLRVVPRPAELRKDAVLGPQRRVRYLSTDTLALARQIESPGEIQTSFEGVREVWPGWWYVLDLCAQPGVSVWPPERFKADFEMEVRHE